MPKLIDLTDQTFGRVTVTSRAPNRGKHTAWNVICCCGKKRVVLSQHLRSGATQNCGCFRKERNVTHGHTRDGKQSQEYQAWRNAKARCFNPNFRQFKDYGGRGITMCNEWRNNFSAFLHDVGPRPPGLSLDRIDTDGDYRPGNCQWADKAQQCRNKRNNRFLECNGIRKIFADWAAELGISSSALSQKLKRGITLESLVEQEWQQIPKAA